MKLAAEAGADVLYPVGRHSDADMRRLTAELPRPVNAIGIPDTSDKAELAAQGVARISFGPYLQFALAEEAKRLLARWT